MEKKAVLLVIAANVVYGCSFMMTSLAIESSQQALFGLLASRFLIAFLVLGLLVACRVLKVSYRGKPVWELAVISLLYPGVYFFSEAMALTEVNSGIVGVVIGIAPTTTAILNMVFFKKKQSIRQLALMAVSIVGVVLVNAADTVGQGLSGKAILFLALALFSFSAYSIGIHAAGKDFAAPEITWFMMFSGAVVFNLLDGITRGPFAYWQDFSVPSYLLAVLFLGVLTSAGSSLALNYGLCKLPPVMVSVLNNVTSVVAVVCGVIFLREVLPLGTVVGCVLILVGCTGYSLISSDTSQGET